MKINKNNQQIKLYEEINEKMGKSPVIIRCNNLA